MLLYSEEDIMLDKMQKDFDKKTQEEKIEILDKTIEKNTKKLNLEKIL